MKIKLDPKAIMPTRAHATDAGLDLYAPCLVYVNPHCSVTVDTGVHVELPEGTVGLIKSKSGLNIKRGITCEGVIDVGYTGSIQAKLYNHSSAPVMFERGDKITQLVVVPCLFPELELVDELDETERGDKGIGSTGR